MMSATAYVYRELAALRTRCVMSGETELSDEILDLMDFVWKRLTPADRDTLDPAIGNTIPSDPEDP